MQLKITQNTEKQEKDTNNGVVCVVLGMVFRTSCISALEFVEWDQ